MIECKWEIWGKRSYLDERDLRWSLFLGIIHTAWFSLFISFVGCLPFFSWSSLQRSHSPNLLVFLWAFSVDVMFMGLDVHCASHFISGCWIHSIVGFVQWFHSARRWYLWFPGCLNSISEIWLQRFSTTGYFLFSWLYDSTFAGFSQLDYIILKSGLPIWSETRALL